MTDGYPDNQKYITPERLREIISTLTMHEHQILICDPTTCKNCIHTKLQINCTKNIQFKEKYLE